MGIFIEKSIFPVETIFTSVASLASTTVESVTRKIHTLPPYHSQPVAVCCNTCARGIIGSAFFEKEKRAVVTIISAYCFIKLSDYLHPNVKENVGDVWFQQDGTMCHTGNITYNRYVAPGVRKSRHHTKLRCQMVASQLGLNCFGPIFVLRC